MIDDLKTRLKNSDSSLTKIAVFSLTTIRHLEFPLIRPVHSLVYDLHTFFTGLIAGIARFFYWTPLFKSRLSNNPKNLYLYSRMPLLMGSLNITMGDNCRLSGHTTLSGRVSRNITPRLVIGNNVGISWQNEIFVGDRIEIGNNVRMAVKVRLVGYPGHPVDAWERARGLPDKDEQIGNIIIKDNVWLAAGVTVMGGVTIGAGTIVATGSVVTRDLPSGVLAGGMPAKVIRPLNQPAPTENEKG